MIQAEIKQLKQVRKSSHPESQKSCFLYVRLIGETMGDGHLLETLFSIFSIVAGNTLGMRLIMTMRFC